MDKLRIISVKTQVRRLKYFSVFSTLLGKKGSSLEILGRGIDNWVECHRIDFQNYTPSSGEINPKRDKSIGAGRSLLIKKNTTQSIKNYLEAAKSMGLVNRERVWIYPSLSLVILRNLVKDLSDDSMVNAYTLHDIEKIFYLKTLLKYDADIFLCVYNMLTQEPKLKLNKYLKKYRSYYIEHLEKKLDKTKPENKRYILDALKRVKDWKSAKRYSEHIVAPRLNWGIDMGVVKFLSKDEFYIPNVEYNTLVDLVEGDFFIQAARLIDIKDITLWKDINDLEKERLLFNYIQLAENLFNVLKLPKLPYEETLLLIAFKALQHNKVIVEPYELEKWIGYERNIRNLKIGVRKSGRIYESYLYLKHEG